MSGRSVARAVTLLVVVATAVLVLPVFWLQLDEGAVPSSSDGPELPTGVTVSSYELRCGSGGCWRELTLVAPDGASRAALAARAGVQHQTCAADSWLDRRRVCSHVEVTGGKVRLYVQYDRARWF